MRTAALAAVLTAGLVVAFAAAPQDGPVVGDLPPMPPVHHLPSPPAIRVETYVEGLEIVWGLQFAPDGRLFVTERPGRIRTVAADGTLDREPWRTLDNVHHQEESGLLGLALHPGFPNEPWVYVMYTARAGGGIVNRISRFREVNSRGAQEQVLFDNVIALGKHSGGRIRFGPDGMLYVGTGDAFERWRSQDVDDPAGSILRLTPEGDVPDDNPWPRRPGTVAPDGLLHTIPGNPIWAYGLRNVAGLTWHPRTAALFAADHGPSGETPGIRHRDRIAVIRKGGNHGWPDVVAAPGLPEYEDPILVFVPAAPPGDLLFYDGDLMPEFRGDLLLSVLGFLPRGGQTLMRIRFEDQRDPHRPTAIERWFNDGNGNSVYGRLRGMTIGPDGALYIGTSNRDGRELIAGPRKGDDRILRIRPAADSGRTSLQPGRPPTVGDSSSLFAPCGAGASASSVPGRNYEMDHLARIIHERVWRACVAAGCPEQNRWISGSRRPRGGARSAALAGRPVLRSDIPRHARIRPRRSVRE